MTSATNALYTPGAIGNVIKRTGDNGQGLEPDEEKSSRPVLRGLESGNTLRLPGRRKSKFAIDSAYDEAYHAAYCKLSGSRQESFEDQTGSMLTGRSSYQ